MKKFFPVRMMRHWPWLPREAIDALSLKMFKVRRDGILNNMVQWEVSLPMVGGLELGDL